MVPLGLRLSHLSVVPVPVCIYCGPPGSETVSLGCIVCSSLRMMLSSSSSVSVALGDTTVVVNANPFRIDFIMDKEPVMSVNAKGLLNFEHLREKSQ